MTCDDRPDDTFSTAPSPPPVVFEEQAVKNLPSCSMKPARTKPIVTSSTASPSAAEFVRDVPTEPTRTSPLAPVEAVRLPSCAGGRFRLLARASRAGSCKPRGY